MSDFALEMGAYVVKDGAGTAGGDGMENKGNS